MTNRLPPNEDDPRVKRSRAALVAAFNRLLLAEGYEAITPASIARAAGVARSTFYEHFASKPALLRHALLPVLQPLAHAVDPRCDAERDAAPNPGPFIDLDAVLAHFRQQRPLVRVVFTGSPRRVVESRLAELIGIELRKRRYRARVPLPIVSAHVTHGQLAMIEAWLFGHHACDVAAVARALRAATTATVEALRADPMDSSHRSHGAASSTGSA